MQPNFKPKNIVKTIEIFTQNGLKIVNQASKGNDWESVVELMGTVPFNFKIK